MAVSRRIGLVNGGLMNALGTMGRVSYWMRDLLHSAHGLIIPEVASPLEPHRKNILPRPYDLRKQSLPRAYTAHDWERTLNYWDHCCAVCERPRGLWHTLAQDHWIPLTSPNCPGTVTWNILPLCHGDDGCNNSKGKKDPAVWLQSKLGKRRANRKLREIAAYITWAEATAARRPGCPQCGGVVRHEHYAYIDRVNPHVHDGYSRCLSCEFVWDDYETHTYAHCPGCDCYMQPTMTARSLIYHCPRCTAFYAPHDLPQMEWCPGCARGILRWTTEDATQAGFWRCTHCLSEWIDAD
jgi:predicted RNA-binding Zn-ribbon protein involved in translation (DUF1610 family)